MKKLLITIAVFLLTGGVCWSQSYNPVGLEWDHNTEPDLAGYNIYEAEAAGGYTTFSFSVPAGTNTFDFSPGHPDGVYFWVVTAYDNAGNESGYSNEVAAEFDSGAPAPPTGCSLRW